MDIKSMTLSEFTDIIIQKGYPKFRAKQIYDWMHVKLVRNVEEMKNVPKEMRQWIAQDFVSLEVVERYESKLDGTNKFVFRLQDGNVIESVFMFLCVDINGLSKESDCVRDVRSDICNYKSNRSENIERCCNGNRRTTR